MSLYPPNPIFSDADKRLLALMAKVLVEPVNRTAAQSNLPPESISLTDPEAEELANGLDQVVKSRKFLEAAYFAEAVTIRGEQETAREIYLSERKRNGRSRALASKAWAELQSRLGINIPSIHRFNTNPMSYSYFEKMERILLTAAGLHPHVINIAMTTIKEQEATVDAIRAGKRRIKHGLIKQAAIDPLLDWLQSSHHLPNRTIPKEKLSAGILVIADISVMFTTRDWSTTGTLSTIAGGIATLIL